MPAGLGFMVEAIFCTMDSLHLGALYVQLSVGSLVLIAACSVRSDCLLYLLIVNIVVLSHHTLCPVVRERCWRSQ